MTSNLTTDTEWFRLSNSPKNIITFGEGCEGLAVLGQTGSAKTSSMRTAIRRLLRLGLGGVVFTVKDDSEPGAKDGEFETWKKFCSDEGRAADVVELRPGIDSFNFITAEAKGDGRSEDALIENIIEVMLAASAVIDGKHKTDIWDKAAKGLMRSILTIIVTARDEIKIEELYDCFSSMPKGTDQASVDAFMKRSPIVSLINDADAAVKANPKRQHPDLQISLNYIFKEWPNIDQKTTSSVVFTLTALCDTLRRSPLRDWLCGKTTVSPADCRKGKIILINYPILKYGESARLAQVIIKASCQRIWQRVGGEFVFKWFDEVQYGFHPTDTDFASTRRSLKVIDVIMLQNLPLFYTKAGEDAKNVVMAYLGNMNTKLFFLNSDKETNEYASGLYGDALVRRRNYGKSSNSNGGGFSGGSSRGENEVWEPVVRPVEFTKLKNGRRINDFYTTGYVFQTGRTWSNGKNYLKVTFDQKIGQRVFTSKKSILSGAVFLFFLAVVAQAYGFLPTAGEYLPGINVSNSFAFSILNFIYDHEFFVFPTALAVITAWWRWPVQVDIAR
jgi:hypothetical protein